MSTFTFGFVISQLAVLNRVDLPNPLMKKLCIKVYARPELHKDLEQTVLEQTDCIADLLKFVFAASLWKGREIVAVYTKLSRRWFSLRKVGHCRITGVLNGQASRQLGPNCVQVSRYSKVLKLLKSYLQSNLLENLNCFRTATTWLRKNWYISGLVPGQPLIGGVIHTSTRFVSKRDPLINLLILLSPFNFRPSPVSYQPKPQSNSTTALSLRESGRWPFCTRFTTSSASATHTRVSPEWNRWADLPHRNKQ